MNTMAGAVLLCLLSQVQAGGIICLTEYRTEYRDIVSLNTEFNPTTRETEMEAVFGVNATGARLSWFPDTHAPLSNVTRGQEQLAYEIRIAEDGAAAGTYAWESGKTNGADQHVTVPVALKAGASYYWSVRMWLSSNASTPTQWGCGDSGFPVPFDTAPEPTVFPGKARWVGGGGQLRSKSGLVLPAGSIASARAWVTGVGAFYLFVNGEKVGKNVMDPPQTVYSKTVLYSTFDIVSLLHAGQTNHIGALLGNYKFGYTDQWCNMTKGGGPNGCRALMLKVDVIMADGSTHSVDTSNPVEWEARTGPVVWDHFFHGESYDATLDLDWAFASTTTTDATKAATNATISSNTWAPAVLVVPSATAPTGMQVLDKNGVGIALGQVRPTRSPPLRVTGYFPAESVSGAVSTHDVGMAYVFDFGINIAGMVTLNLEVNHTIPRGTVLRLEHGEVVQGPAVDTEGMCKLCPNCCKNKLTSCDSRGSGAVCDTYCNNPTLSGKGADDHPLRHEPCFPHQSYTPGFPANGIKAHDTPDRYIGDFNNGTFYLVVVVRSVNDILIECIPAANQTNLYTVSADGKYGETYTAYFAAAGFRYVQLSGLPAGVVPTLKMLTAKRVHSNVRPASDLQLPPMPGSTFGTPNVLQRIHDMTVASQATNLWSIPTDCPQRERRGWLGDAQASADEANMNFDMQAFYEEFLFKIRDDQLRFNGNHPTDTGALADVVPFDGIGGNPGCPVWQVAYIVIARQMWKHYGDDVVHSLRVHYEGLKELMAWFDRHADKTDGLLVTSCYGDWMGFNPESGNGGSSKLTPRDSVTAFYHVLAMKYLGEIASAIGEDADAIALAARYSKGQAAYHARYWDASKGCYNPCTGPTCHGTSSAGSQTTNSMALMLGAPPDDATAKAVAKQLMEDVVAFGNKTTTGVVGISFLFPALDQYGYGDAALSVLLNDAYPSIGHMAHQNMTTLCENLACTFHNAGGGSQNHIMLGGFDAWVLSSIGGLDSAVNGTDSGWRHVISRVSPAAVTRVGHASYTKDTRFGAVTIKWSYAQTKLTIEYAVPVGVQLTMHSPRELIDGGVALGLTTLHEGAHLLWAAGSASGATNVAGVRAMSMGTEALQVTVGSGLYRFEASYAPGAVHAR
jgi:alpha-L-rhamnosidase